VNTVTHCPDGSTKQKSVTRFPLGLCELNQIALSLNTRPRKRHDFRTPLQVYNEHLQLAEANDGTVH
jgi:hypothetical protein